MTVIGRFSICILWWLALALTAQAGDLRQLKQAVEREDKAAALHWLEAEEKSSPADPLERIADRPTDPQLEQQARWLFTEELTIQTLTMAWINGGDAKTQSELLGHIDSAIQGRGQLEQQTSAIAAQPLPPDIRLTQLFTAGTGQDGRLAPPASRFDLDERAVYVRFLYENGIPGEELRARWLRIDPTGKAHELSRASMRLEKAEDRGQFSFTPEKGWQEGAYQVEIMGRNRLLDEVDFIVGNPAPPALPQQLVTATPPPPAKAKPAAPKPAPVKKPPPPKPKAAAKPPAKKKPAAKPAPKKAAPPPAGVKLVKAFLAKNIQKDGPHGETSEFNTAWRKLFLWVRAQAPAGGELTAKWYFPEEQKEAVDEHTLQLPPGESQVAFWVKLLVPEEMFPVGDAYVDLYADGKRLQRIDFHIRKAGFFETLSDTLEQAGNELERLADEVKEKVEEQVESK